MTTLSQKADISFKRDLFERSAVNEDIKYFEEPLTGSPYIFNNRIIAGTIPATGPLGPPKTGTAGVSGDVELIKNLTLIPVSQSNGKSFYHPNLRNAVQFNYDPSGSYLYYVTTNAGTPIPFGAGDWIVDSAVGTLTFYEYIPAGVSNILPPKISFYRYTGSFGALTQSSSVDHTLIQNIGTNTHLQIDSHIASTSNPHNVTINQVSPLTTKGDLLTHDATTNSVRLPVGSNGQVLTADSSQANGLIWSAFSATLSDYESFNGAPIHTTTSTTPIDVINVTTASKPAGTYLVIVDYAWNFTGANATLRNFSAQLLIDSSTIWTHVEEPKDPASTQRIRNSVIRSVTFGSTTTHNIQLQMFSENTENTSSMFGSQLIIFRTN